MLAGQDFLPGTCGNIDGKGVTANLNWNACNCTNKPIQTASSSAGLMAEDGYSPMVLLDPSLNVIDAAIRGLPGAATGPVTSSSVSGGCSGKTFDIGTMNINYEVLGMAPGNQNGYARTRDGDCVWVKETQQSGGATNNRSGSTSDLTYQFNMVSPTDCGDKQGTVSIYVKYSNYGDVFPMTYTLAMDSNNDGVFDLNDQYRTDTVYNPPFIEITNLPVGRYSVTVASAKGCYLQNFGPFQITTCNPSTLPVRLVYFKNKDAAKDRRELEWLLQEVQNLQSVVVEKATDAGNFVTEKILVNNGDRGSRLYSATVETGTSYRYFRLKITQKDGRSFYSPVLNIAATPSTGISRIWPNPATDKLNIELSGTANQKLAYCIYNTAGLAVAKGPIAVSREEKTSSILLPAALPPGVYQLQVEGASGTGQPISFRFVKH